MLSAIEGAARLSAWSPPASPATVRTTLRRRGENSQDFPLQAASRGVDRLPCGVAGRLAKARHGCNCGPPGGVFRKPCLKLAGWPLLRQLKLGKRGFRGRLVQGKQVHGTSVLAARGDGGDRHCADNSPDQRPPGFRVVPLACLHEEVVRAAGLVASSRCNSGISRAQGTLWN